MALKWLLSFTQVLGHTENGVAMPNDDKKLKGNDLTKGFHKGSSDDQEVAEMEMMKHQQQQQQLDDEYYPSGFQMPLHYPRYKKSDYEKMEEWKLDLLLKQYGLCFQGTLDERRAFAMGAFLWPDQT